MMSLQYDGMKVITVRQIPDDLYRAIADLARKNRRSIQQQVLMLLEQARVSTDPSPVALARSIREGLAGRCLGKTVEEIRKERER